MSERQFNYPPRKKPSTQSAIQNRDVNATERARRALKLRSQMLTYDEIAAQCGYSTRDAARKAILRELDRVVVKDVEELRKTELHMLNMMHSEIWKMFIDVNNKGRLFAADRILAISERRSKLMGLDIPVDQAMNTNITLIREVPAGYLGIVEAQP
jgi:hypothetical protein